jgi:tRNA-dihydrouridine synthase 3
MSLARILTGAVVMAPMTKGSNLPYRQLCAELGARVLVSEMVVARRLKQKRKSEFALIRRFPGEPVFGVQLAGTNPADMAWAAALVQASAARGRGDGRRGHARAHHRQDSTRLERRAA